MQRRSPLKNLLGGARGAWWEGNKRQTAPGYGLIDLYADGTFRELYVNY